MAISMNATVTAYNAILQQPQKDICDMLASVIQSSLTNSTNKVWHGHPVWFINGNPIVGYSVLKNTVRLLFWSGQGFSESGLSIEGSFKAAEARYVSAGDIDVDKLERWLEESKTIQWDYKNIVKRKGVLLKL